MSAISQRRVSIFAATAGDATQPAQPSALHSGGILRRQLFLNLARRYPHDVDGVTDHVGGLLLALGSLGHEFGMHLFLAFEHQVHQTEPDDGDSHERSLLSEFGLPFIGQK
jgi:hypothetical protein